MKDTFVNNQKALYEDSEKWGRGYHRVNLERVKYTIESVPPDVKTILDLGSGDGLVFNMLKQNGYHAVALDISRNALKFLHGEKLVQGAANQLPLSSKSFDLIISCEMLEHIPNSIYRSVLDEIMRVTKKYILITVPYREKLQWNFARCPDCGCIFNGAYHVKSFNDDDIKFLLESFKCIKLNRIVKVLHPDRTFPIEVFVRQHLAKEYLYYGPSVKCPLCLSSVREKPARNWIGWLASGMRYLYRIPVRKKTHLWYLALYQKIK
jgi:SAM-dependent methyltransferase